MAHLAPAAHQRFYNMQRFTLNITRADMRRVGYAPSVRLFEAAACATPVISDDWEGIDAFFTPGEEILISRTAADTLAHLRELCEAKRRAIGARARARMLAEHTAAHRAEALEGYVLEALQRRRGRSRRHSDAPRPAM
jgi:spore maturation protein CgeB